MEADDDLVPPPDSKGLLDLSNRAWVNLDPVIWTYSLSLVVLDISYNHIEILPPQIGELVLLKEFRASFNKIGVIPSEMGNLRRLRKLYLNSNRLRKLPSELGRLEMLEEMILSENAIDELPQTIELMANLRVLKLANNRLRVVPNELSEIVTLEDVDCSNNPDLDMIPARWRGDTDSVLFTCKVHRGYSIKMAELMQTNDDLTKHAQFLEQEQLVMKEAMGNLRHEIEEVRRHLPKKIAKRLAAEAAAREQIIDTGDETKKSFCNIS